MPRESGKYYGLYECIYAMANRFELREMGTKSCSCKGGCNAYKVEESNIPDGSVMFCEM